MSAVVIYLEDALMPARRRIEQVDPASIASLAPRDWIRPHIALLDGEPVLRADWTRIVPSGSTLAFIDVDAIPQGGGGSNPLRLVLTVAVMWATSGLGGALLGVQGAAAVGGLGVALANAAAQFLGMALVNALVPPPKPPTPQLAASLAAPSPTYSLQAQGNSARIDDAIPEHFGRIRAFPDFAAQPYVEYSGNEQYLYQLLCIGRGHYDVEAIQIEDTPIASFDEVVTELVAPGGAVSLFPANVTSSGEVAGQELALGEFVGGFVASASETEANYIGVDFVATRGLYEIENNGSLSARTATVEVQIRRVDAVGAPVSGWTPLLTKTYRASTTTPQRYSEKVAVAPGRYEVRATRLDAKTTNSRAANDIAWAGLRAYLPDTRTFGDVTLLAVRMRASNNLSGQSSRKVNVIATRKLPLWNGATWSAPTVTSSAAWAFAYACKQVGFTDAQLDLPGLLALDATCSARGDRFDGRFDNFLNFWEAITRICGAVRAKPFMQGGLIRVRRDQQVTLPVAMFSVRNIVRGSLSIDYVMPSIDTADAVDVKYFDGVAWAPATVRAKLSGSVAAQPAKVDLFGVTQRAQAYREGLYMAAANRYRRKIVRFQTEMEGFIPTFGDLIVVQHDLPNWGQGGDVVAYDVATRTATLSEPVTFTTGNHYIALRRRDGSVAGPYLVTAGTAANQVVFDAVVPPETPYTGSAEERTHFAFGPGEAWRQRALVLSVKPDSLNTVTIEAINEDENVHLADTGVVVPPLQTGTLPKETPVPVVTGLAVRASPYSPTKVIATWQPAPWASYYALESSVDGTDWTRLGETGGNTFTFDTPSQTTYVRVAAIGGARGPWSQITFVVAPPPSVEGLAAEGAFDTAACRIKWTPAIGATGYQVQVYSGAVLRRTVYTVDPRYSYTAADAQSDGGLARSLRFDVSSVGVAGNAVPATITLTNAQVAAPTNARAEVGFGSLTVSADTPADSDYRGTIIWKGAASGFALNDATKIYDGPAPTHSFPATPGEEAWFAMAHFDAFGKDALNPSSYFSATPLTPGGVPTVATTPGTTYLGSDIVYSKADESLFQWNASATPAPTYERSQPQVVANQITTIDLKAMSAVIGELSLGRMVLDAFGYVRGGQSDFNVGSGFWLGYKDAEYKLSVGNVNNDRMTFDGTGLKVYGQMTIESANEVPVPLNGTFDTLSGWYVPNAGVTAWEAAGPAAGVDVENFEGDNRLAGSNFAITSSKFAVNEGETYSISLDVRQDYGVTQGVELQVVFDSNPALADPAVGLGGTVFLYLSVARVDRDASQTDPVGWVTLRGTFTVPDTARWASLYLYGYTT